MEVPILNPRSPPPGFVDPSNSVGDGRSEVFYSRLIMLIPHLRIFARIYTSEISVADYLVANCISRSLVSANQHLPLQNLKVAMFYILRNDPYTDLVRAAETSYPNAQVAPEPTRRDLETALVGLPILLKESLMLLDYEAFSAAEAGTICRTSENFIQGRARDARRRVQEFIGPDDGDADSGDEAVYADYACI